MSMLKFTIPVIVIVLWGCLPPKITLSGIDIPDNVNTVSVELFENQAALTNPNFPQLFTESLRDKFIRQTRLKMVSRDGDLQFAGVITGYSTQPVAVSGSETASLTRLTISVAVRYENTVDDNKSFTQSFARFADFDISQTLAAVEDALMNQIIEQLVQDVFNRAFLNW